MLTRSRLVGKNSYRHHLGPFQAFFPWTDKLSKTILWPACRCPCLPRVLFLSRFVSFWLVCRLIGSVQGPFHETYVTCSSQWSKPCPSHSVSYSIFWRGVSSTLVSGPHLMKAISGCGTARAAQGWWEICWRSYRAKKDDVISLMSFQDNI